MWKIQFCVFLIFVVVMACLVITHMGKQVTGDDIYTASGLVMCFIFALSRLCKKDKDDSDR